ncbi:hypothetical protein PN499_25545 [Kamptonema animale CS-326]|jgi:L-lactate utilization protein LutB|uniref:hypothetical protein n=1 Tax=Kamptonema animale TaxID=92934 RepID=UPI00233020CF|nr:hypothetical protein [Kamptonema animale]MDB9514569.1 hypothetical protein [Kamptonema animale CS-326]
MTSQQIEQQIQAKAISSLEPLTPEQVQKTIDMLDEWCNVDEEEAQEQRETLEYLMKVIDEDRSSYRKLFP